MIYSDLIYKKEMIVRYKYLEFTGIYKEKFNTKSLYFVTLIVNLITVVITFDVFLFFLDPMNW